MSYTRGVYFIASCMSLVALVQPSQATPASQPRAVWEHVCSKEDPSPLPREAGIRRVLTADTRPTDQGVQSECYGPGTRYRVPLSTELSQLTFFTPLSRPAQIAIPGTPVTTANSWTFTLQIDRRYLCHRLQRKVAFGEYTLDQGAEIVAALTRLRSYIGQDVLRLPPVALNYLQKSVALQLKRSLSDEELRQSSVKSFRTIHPVK